MRLKERNNYKKALFITIIVSIIIISLDSAKVFQRNDWMLHDWYIKQFRDNLQAPKDISIILIDEASLHAMNPVVGRWPWPRSIMSDVIDFISSGNPKAIILDVLFSESQTKEQNNADDQQLIRATKNADKVVHAQQFIQDSVDKYNPKLLNQALPAHIVKRFSHNIVLPGEDEHNKHYYGANKYNNFLVPFNGLYQASRGIGTVTINRDRDSVIRRAPLFLNYQNLYYPALSLAPLLLENSSSIEYKENQLKINGKNITVNKDLTLEINYYGKFNTLSMSGILSSIQSIKTGDIEELIIDPGEFEKKYVFIGASAIGLHDLKTTSINERLPGVVVHASILGNFLNNDFLQPAKQGETIFIIIIATLLTCFSLFSTHRISLQIIFPLFISALILLWSSWQYSNSNIVNVSPALAALLVAWVSTYGFLLLTEGKEKKQVRKFFSQYVSPAALSIMVDNYEDYQKMGAGSKQVVSMLFSDIRGFTTLSESLAAEQVVEILNHYLTDMTKVIHQYQGTIDKFIGDAIMATWGAPIVTSDHAQQAVEAAMEMVRQLDVVNQWLDKNNYAPIDVGIGIHTGQVIMGSIGSEQKADFTVIGDNVNLASRLEGVTKNYACKTIISEDTHEMLHDIHCMVVDMVRVKGKQNPIKIYSPLIEGVDFSNNDFQQASRLSDLSRLAFDHYIKQQWEEAISAYQQLSNNAFKQIYIARCEAFSQNPPPADWDGVYIMTSK